MSTTEVAHGLVDLCRQHHNLEAVEKYYADDIVSIESASGPMMPSETKGMEAVKGKNAWWLENHEIHSSTIHGPFVGEGDQFAVYFAFDVTQKPTGQRMQLEEMGLYTVAEGKVTREHFFYKTS